MVKAEWRSGVRRGAVVRERSTGDESVVFYKVEGGQWPLALPPSSSSPALTKGKDIKKHPVSQNPIRQGWWENTIVQLRRTRGDSPRGVGDTVSFRSGRPEAVVLLVILIARSGRTTAKPEAK